MYAAPNPAAAETFCVGDTLADYVDFNRQPMRIAIIGALVVSFAEAQAGPPFPRGGHGSAYTATVSMATTATYCFPFLP